MLNTNMVSGAVPLTHTGSYRVWARLYSSGVNAQFRLVWGNAGMAVPITNEPQVMPNNTAGFFMTDLGPIRIDAPPVGVNQWLGVIQTNAVASGLVDIDCLYFQPLDEGAGKLTYTSPAAPASSIAATGMTGLGADDATVGTVAWSSPNQISVPSQTVCSYTGAGVQSHYLKATTFGFSIPSGATIVGIQLAVSHTSVGGSSSSAQDASIRLVKAGTIQTTNRSAGLQWPFSSLVYTVDTYGGPTDLWGGTWTPSDINNSGFGAVISAISVHTGTAAVNGVNMTIYYTLASGFTVAPDAVLAASRTIELRTDGMYRQGAGGTIFAPVSQVTGDLPRIPPSGLESRTVQVFLKASRGEFDNEADTGIDDLSAQIIYRPELLDNAIVPDASTDSAARSHPIPRRHHH